MKNIAIIYGGNSLEKDISVITGIQVMNNISKKYNIYPIYFNGNFYLQKYQKNLDKFLDKLNKNKNEVTFIDECLYQKKCRKAKFLTKIDCAVLCTHGSFGENGVIQGYLDINNIPYTSPNVFVSSICMNKFMSKQIFKSLKVNTIKGYLIKNFSELENIKDKLTYPIIVKPNSAGSSIGISIANNYEDLLDNYELALCYDKEVILEQALEDFKELNIAVYKDIEEIKTSEIEEVTFNSDIYSFNEKYLDSDNIKHVIPAEISQKNIEYLKKTSKCVYEKLGALGIVRFDYLLDNKTGKIYLNEVNTIPGSLAFNLVKSDEFLFENLLDTLIDMAINNKDTKKIEYKTNVLENFKQMQAMPKTAKNKI